MQTLVYVHGLGDDGTTWQLLQQASALEGVHQRSYLVPGFGERPWNGEHVEDVAKDLANYIAELSTPVIVVGHSLGGAIGTILSESAPENLEGFVNIEGNLTPADCGISGAAARASDFGKWFDSFATKMPARYAQALTRADRRAFRVMAEDLVRLSDGLADRYLALEVPKLLIYGTKGYDAITQQWISENPVDAVRVEGAGHWVQEDASLETAAGIVDFLG